jgi:hypothetical protein
MNDEPDQLEGSAHGEPVSALCERLFRRHSEPIGVINVREAEQHYERIMGWIADRYALLELLLRRYRIDDWSGDGQPFVLGQAFWSMIDAAPTPAPPGALLSPTVSLSPASQPALPEASSARSLKTSVAPPVDSGDEAAPSAPAKFRVSRRPPPVSDIERSDDWQSGGGAARQSATASHQADEGQPTHQQATPSSFTAQVESDKRQPPLSLELAQTSPAQARPPAGERTTAAAHDGVSESPSVDAARPARTVQASAEQPVEAQAAEERQSAGGAPTAEHDGVSESPSVDAARPASADQAPNAKPLVAAREIGQKAAGRVPPSEPPQLELAQSSPARPPAGERLGADEKTVNAEHDGVSESPSVDAARPARTVQASAEQPVEAQAAEERQSAGGAPTAEPLAIAREITGRTAEATRPPDPLLLKEDSATRQTSRPQPTQAVESGRATESPSPDAAAESRVAPHDKQPLPLRAPAASPDSPALRRAVEIKPAAGQAERGEPIDLAVASSPAQTAPRGALSAPSRSPESSSHAAPSGPPMAAEMQSEPLHSRPADLVWRASDEAATETAFRQPGGTAPPAVNRFDASAPTPFSATPDQRAAQPATQEQGGQADLEKLPDHVINRISQQVIRTLSRLLVVERERKGIR